MRFLFAVLFLLAAAGRAAGPPPFTTPPSSPPFKVQREQREAVDKLPDKYRQWVLEVDPILTQEEKKAFLELTKDYQRDAFIERFWAVRDPNPRTGRNEFRERWEAKVQQARLRFPDLRDVRARIFLLNGEPAEVVESKCPLILWPLEVWFYPRAERLNEEFIAVFYRKWGEKDFRLWHPGEGTGVLFAQGVGQAGPADGVGFEQITDPVAGCGDTDKSRKIAAALRWSAQKGLSYDLLRARFETAPEGPGKEWVSTFGSYSTDLPEGAALLPGQLAVDFPGRHLSQTVLQGVVTVAAADAGAATFEGYRSWNFLLTGEVLRDGRLFDNFRYKFDFPAGEASFPLVFQRFLRPGEYTLVLKVEDVNSGKVYREERPLVVPLREEEAAATAVPASADPETARLLAEANAALGTGEPTIRIVPPHGELQTGMLRFDTLVTGPRVAGVTFQLDGKPVLTKKKPPYSVELDLGSLPRPRTLTATVFDEEGAEIASDELLINAAAHRFRVELVEPRKGRHYQGSLLARAEVDTPEGGAVERVELFLDETRVATLFQPPWEQPVVLPPGGQLAYVRAVAYLTDGNSTEDLVFVNAPESFEEIDIDLVELYTTVLDRKGRPVSGLDAKDFAVFEDGDRQEVVRFERVTDQPIHAAVAIDVSASMEESLDDARQAALGFLKSAIRPKDRAAVLTFNDHPNLAAKFTSDLGVLAGGLAGLKAERGTALYDALIFSLYYFNGLKGQRALLLVSDGKDEGSRFGFEEALEYARRAGVTIYTIGLGKEADKKKLERISEETGGRSFFLRDAAELPGIYAAIEEELRSQYLIAYQSTNTTGSTAFRTVELKVGKPGVEGKTMQGYYP